MKLLTHILLRPLSFVYGIVITLRNILYDAGVFRSYSFSLPVICVGNLTVGGTGKTPHVIFLAELLSGYMPVAVLSRGYLRRTRGFRIVSNADSVSDAGDEPLLIAGTLPHVRVIVDRDRVHGIKELQKIFPETGVVILDDGYQHRAVNAGMNILLTDYNRLMTRDYLMPSGRLRESVRGMKRADIIIVTKVPSEVSPEIFNQIRNELKPRSWQELYFTTLTYGKLEPVFGGSKEKEITVNTGVVLVTGIADPEPLRKYISTIASSVTHLSFEDHHTFNRKDTDSIMALLDGLSEPDKLVITTEKDCVRLKEFTIIADHLKEVLYYLPVKVIFSDKEEKFTKRVIEYAGKDNRDSNLS